MLIVGELFDGKMARKIRDDLSKKGIAIQIHEVPLAEGRLYRLEALHEKDAAEAFNFFRVCMGLGAPPVEVDPDWDKMSRVPLGPVTLGILLLSGVLFLCSFQQELFLRLTDLLFIGKRNSPLFQEVVQGEIWRLITPIFLHFGILHIIFNGLWMKVLGSLFEKEEGAMKYLLFLFVVGALSNVSQYLIFGPNFGGLSGVIYGLLGYLWVYGKTHSEAQYHLPKRDLKLIIGWYFLCLTGLIGNIANIAHGVGLGIGMIYGLFPLRKIDKQIIQYFIYALLFSLGTIFIEFYRHSLA